MATHQPDVSVTFGVSATPPRRSTTVRQTRRARVLTPDLTGLPISEAVGFARSAAVSITVQTLSACEGPIGQVVTQYPAPGAPIRPGGRIIVGVPGAARVMVPDLVRLSESDAIEFIVSAGLVPGERQPRGSSTGGRPEVVLRSRPESGTSVEVGTRVDLELAPMRQSRRNGNSDFDAADMSGRERRARPVESE